ncbi:MAG: HAMP domain-containing protein, partial [Candidatus Krumholzibacteria bacterium]|nr:HAMP domain-containing protein [Candidatus Krumholzibacteria bacterium]
MDQIHEKTPSPVQAAAVSHRRRRSRRVVSMRLIVTLVAVGLVVVAVVGAGTVAERNAREALMREVQGRLVLEARNLALLSSSALLDEFPELTLHPLVKDMHSGRSDLAFARVADHNGVVQGHEDVKRLGTPLDLPSDLSPIEATVRLGVSERLIGNHNVLVAVIPIRHAKGNVIGTAIVGFDHRQAEQTFIAARQKLLLFLIPVLGGAILLTFVLLDRLLRPITALRAGIERIARGDLRSRVDVTTRTELGVLAVAINEMAEELELARDQMREKERLDVEMKLARDIQRSLLPTRSIVAGDFMITGAQTSALDVGGDYYDILELDNDRIGIVIADVS